MICPDMRMLLYVQTRSFLCVVVEATHLYVRMMERYCRGSNHMIVQQKKKKTKSGKKKVNCKNSSIKQKITTILKYFLISRKNHVAVLQGM